jgi:hypothetical protein
MCYNSLVLVQPANFFVSSFIFNLSVFVGLRRCLLGALFGSCCEGVHSTGVKMKM